MVMQAPQYPNALRALIKQAGYSFREVSRETTIPESTLYDWAAGNRVIPHTERRLLADLLGCSVEALAPESSPTSIRHSHLVQYPSDEDAQLRHIGSMLMNELRRLLLGALGGAGLVLFASPHELLNPEPWERLVRAARRPSSVNEETLSYFEKLTGFCWHLSNDNEVEAAARILPRYLPHLVALAHQPSGHQRRAAHLAAQGYILAAEIELANIYAMKAYCQQAVLYSQIAQSVDIQAAALKQQATIFLVDKRTEQSLQKYQEALPLVMQVSPLLRARVYLGLASAYARQGQQYKQDALRYLALAGESFPQHPESDPSYLYTVCSLPVLHLYEALTYTDLQQPEEAWAALMEVDGIQPKMHVTESARIEFLNLQAKTAASRKDLEASRTYLQAGVEAASKSGHELWVNEAFDVYQYMYTVWPNEPRVKSLAGLFPIR
jgi:transcriptional regulator with XRE-family HTH domain